MQNTPIHITIVDDHPSLREGICLILKNNEEFIIDFQANNGIELINYLETISAFPDVIILDVSMPEMDGYETIKEISNRWPNLKVLMFSMYEEPLMIEHMIAYGARGFLVKNTSPQLLIQALKDIQTQGYFYSKYATYELFERATENRLQTVNLTPREKETLLLLCQNDLSYREMSKLLYKSESTIKKYRDRLFKKLDANSKLGLAVKAIRSGLIPVYQNDKKIES